MFDFFGSVRELRGISMTEHQLRKKLGELRLRHLKDVPAEMGVDEMLDVLRERGILRPLGEGQFAIVFSS